MTHADNDTAPLKAEQSVPGGREGAAETSAREVPTSSSAKVCISLSVIALLASFGWAAGLESHLVYLATHHVLALAVTVSVSLSFAAYCTRTGWGETVERAMTAAATVLMLYGMVSGWLEVIRTGRYGGFPLIVDPAPGIAINLAIAALIFCLVRHSKLEIDVVEHRWTMANLPVWVSGLVFLLIVGISWKVHDLDRIETQMKTQTEMLKTELVAPYLDVDQAASRGPLKSEHSEA